MYMIRPGSGEEGYGREKRHLPVAIERGDVHENHDCFRETASGRKEKPNSQDTVQNMQKPYRKQALYCV
jgi:hypothetical protein